MTDLVLVKCSKCDKYKGRGEHPPRNGCGTCWKKYFLTHIGVCVLITKMLGEATDRSKAVFGNEMVKQFTRFTKEREKTA